MLYSHNADKVVKNITFKALRTELEVMIPARLRGVLQTIADMSCGEPSRMMYPDTLGLAPSRTVPLTTAREMADNAETILQWAKQKIS